MDSDLLARGGISEFIRANTRLQPVPHAPEILLHLADSTVPLWRKTEPELMAIGLSAPFWAFAWAGGQALARYVLDHRDAIAAPPLLDPGSGSRRGADGRRNSRGRAGRRMRYRRFRRRGHRALNAEANGVYLEILRRDPLGDRAPIEPRYDVILAGDLFYERGLGERALPFLE